MKKRSYCTETSSSNSGCKCKDRPEIIIPEKKIKKITKTKNEDEKISTTNIQQPKEDPKKDFFSSSDEYGNYESISIKY